MLSHMRARGHNDWRSCYTRRVRDMLNLLLQRSDLLTQRILHSLDVGHHWMRQHTYTPKPLWTTAKAMNTQMTQQTRSAPTGTTQGNP